VHPPSRIGYNASPTHAAPGGTPIRHSGPTNPTRSHADGDIAPDDGDQTVYAFVHDYHCLRHDPETGLIENRYRMRHVTLGRWLKRDPHPATYPDGMGRG
jgi:hypothetical protein